MSNFLTPNKIRTDVGESVFFTEQLNYIQARVYNYEYPQRKAFRLIPVDTSAPDGAEFVTYTQFQSVGRARIINSYADDAPNVGLQAVRITQPVISLADCYRYSFQEIRAARMANLDLDSRLAIAAREAIEQEMNDLAFGGDQTTGLVGFLNNPSVPTYQVPNDGVGVSTLWINKTPEQILRDMNQAVINIVANTNGVERPDTLLLPLAQYMYIYSTPRSPNSDTTILDYFLENSEFIRSVEWVPQLAGAGPNGADVMIAYRNDLTKLAMQIPMPFMQHEPQARNFEWVINCEARFGGVTILYPLSMTIAYGI